MKDDDFDRIQPVIEMAQRLHGSLNAKLREKGVEPIDALIAATYAAHHAASELHGNPIAAIEWMRDTIDTIERQILEQAKLY